MASSNVILMTTMAVLLAVVGAAYAAEAPAPSPTSPATAISPSVAVGFVTAAVALIFGSSLRTWTCCASAFGFSISFFFSSPFFMCGFIPESDAWLVLYNCSLCVIMQRFYEFISGSLAILWYEYYYDLSPLIVLVVHKWISFIFEFVLLFYCFSFFFIIMYISFFSNFAEIC